MGCLLDLMDFFEQSVVEIKYINYAILEYFLYIEIYINSFAEEC